MDNEQNETFKVIRKVQEAIIGSIDPIGESNIDEKRLGNLEVHLEVTGSMIGDMFDLIDTNINRYESSRLEASVLAVKFLKVLNQEISDLLGEIE